MSSKHYTVTEANDLIKNLLDSTPFLRNICIIGEISNYKLYPSGHHYFSLKDEQSTIPCVMFKGNAQSLRFRPENGMKVIASGNISSFVRDGKYQFYCNFLMPVGEGSLQIAFDQLKEKLEKEGLFDESHKKRLPLFPKKICVITSSAGAAVHDIIRILGHRWPMSRVVLIPVKVQGAEAPQEICDAIRFANDSKLADVLIVGRGGGSAEDLWCFNDENLARAIYLSEIPVISAVGHEPDVTISDYVADRRASTPSNAAEIAVPDQNDIRGIVEGYKLQIDPDTYLNDKRMILDSYNDSICQYTDYFFSSQKDKLSGYASMLDALSPLKVLSRGYSITLDSQGTAVKSCGEIKSGDKLKIKLSDGEASVTAD